MVVIVLPSLIYLAVSIRPLVMIPIILGLVAISLWFLLYNSFLI